MQKNDFFEGIRQARTKVGPYDVHIPIFYRDLTSISVYLLAPLDKVRSLLPSKRMHPFRVTPRHSIMTISAFEYRDTDVGPYNQVSIGIPFLLDRISPLFMGLLHPPPEIPMIYVLHLPVTTEQSRLIGFEMANYPEFLSEIRFEREREWVHCKVDTEGKNILSLSCRNLPLSYSPRQRVDSFSLRQRRLLRSEFNFSDCEAGVSKKQADVRIEFGTHPIGLELKELNLRRVLQYQYSPTQQAVLSTVCESYPI
jgi:hypothetical protein